MNDFLNLNNYQAQLASPEWQNKRNEILNRDNHRCQICGKRQSVYINFKDRHWHIGIVANCHSQNMVLPTNFSIPEFKSLIGAKVIQVYKIEDTLVGISDNRILGTVYAENLEALHSPDNVCVDLVKYNSGFLSFILRTKDCQPNNINIGRELYISDTPIALEVHHKHYIIQHKAWEYDNESLITLCSECHAKIHQTIGVKIYSNENGYMQQLSLTPCLRCSGTGYFPEYKHVENGVCFRCRGARFEELIRNN